MLLAWENEAYLALEELGPYLAYPYSDEGPAIAASNYYRPFRPEAAAAEDVARFGPVYLDTIEDFGGWHEAQPKFFGDGGVFDQIYATP